MSVLYNIRQLILDALNFLIGCLGFLMHFCRIKNIEQGCQKTALVQHCVKLRTARCGVELTVTPTPVRNFEKTRSSGHNSLKWNAMIWNVYAVLICIVLVSKEFEIGVLSY